MIKCRMSKHFCKNQILICIDNYFRHGQYGGYTKKTVVPVPYTVYGGWDKCIGPFSKYEAKHFGVDEWDCHSNCYTRRDPNGGEKPDFSF